ncbi:3-dehydroquinate synthase [Plasticicumulans lactativorans]|uniref:3-dehydroquinate synthase n=1 Tax=Plasticicumulans lactativorans TaxID=1133106 RepID=A0A4R2L766_9GAMM|nr:3-dehydroquinate synthase [Plasticicumulans lactativorans]TCO81137.1 3-dehydroquinate synthase [Plasticicumulans lactativorans]
MQTLTVDLGDRSYPIHIGPGLLGRPDVWRAAVPGRQVMVVSNTTVAPLYLETVCSAFDDRRVETVVLPDGESFKTLDTLGNVFDALLRARFDRHCTLLALGGGVVGDMTGFAAACYQRGVDFVQLPTTLLAQVDSSVGGKTGVNHPLGKNMIGAFHQPRAVVIDTRTLVTLPDREFAAGLAEVIKYGLIRDLPFLDWLEANLEALLARDGAALTEAIARSCRCKAEIVGRDERESGERALLNLGHTFGHAIETGTGYGVWLHGEAVAAGTCMALDLSARLGWLDAAAVERVRRLFSRAQLPVTAPASLSAEDFLGLMAVDKKTRDGQLTLILLQGLGHGVVRRDVPSAALRATLDAFCH